MVLKGFTETVSKMAGDFVERTKKTEIDLPTEIPDKINLEKYVKEPDRTFSNAKEIFEYYGDFFPGFQLHSKEIKTSWYVAGEIPEEKLQNALVSFLGDVDQNELVILYYDSTQLGKGDDGVAITSRRIIIKNAMKEPVSIYYSEPYEIGFLYEDCVGDKTVTTKDIHIRKSLGRKGVEFFVNKADDQTCFLNFGAKNTFPVCYFLTYLKECRLEDRLASLYRHKNSFYTGHLPKTLKDYPEELKEAYLKTLTPVINADGHIDGSETAQLYNQFIALDCARETRMNIMEALASTADPIANCQNYIETLHKHLCKLDQKAANTVKQGLYKDMVGMAKADFMEFDNVEKQLIKNLGAKLEIGSEIMAKLDKLVEYDIKLSKGEISEKEYIKGAKSLVSGLSALGVSLGALSFSGTVAGLGMTGITSGLAALGGGAGTAGWLGLAAIPGLNVAVLGVGALFIIGAVTYTGARYISGAGEREIKNKREKMVQKVLENHQKSISILQSDMNFLTDNLKAAMMDTAKNSVLIEKLNRQMALFKAALILGKNQQVEMEKEATALI